MTFPASGGACPGAGPFPYGAPPDRPYTLVVDEQADPAAASPFRADGTVLLAPVTSAPARPVAVLKLVNPVP